MTDLARDWWTSRRRFLKRIGVLLVGGLWLPRSVAAATEAGPFQALGARVGELTPDSAVIWARLTAAPERNNHGVRAVTRRGERNRLLPSPPPAPIPELEGACPGAAGRVRARYHMSGRVEESRTTAWGDCSEDSNFIHQFVLDGLTPNAEYEYVVEAAAPGAAAVTSSTQGQFRTAPLATDVQPITFTVMTCQSYDKLGHRDGPPIYPAMQALKPHFAVLTGDLVYYDSNAPFATSPEIARYHWDRMFSLPRLRSFLSQVGAYWVKDDHDTLQDDTWPGQQVKDLSFSDGVAIFQEQAPLGGGPTARTARWGRDLQIWLVEGRDFRSANDAADGAEKSIWGAAQLEWVQRTVEASDATWKVLVSPTPIVGPDRPKKRDNHSNVNFAFEGDRLRAWMQQLGELAPFVVCGDRHWQFHSVDPSTGVSEFSVGPASDEHAGGSPGEDLEYHRFHRVAGGFLSVTVDRQGGDARIQFHLRDVNGSVVYEHGRTRPAPA